MLLSQKCAYLASHIKIEKNKVHIFTTCDSSKSVSVSSGRPSSIDNVLSAPVIVLSNPEEVSRTILGAPYKLSTSKVSCKFIVITVIISLKNITLIDKNF